eukprot:CAMPEP_0177676454 /NCGR_PEP_ID=MMETSP0447-20121125/27804_1 /TAXON_ID=0 /ORGANISM="Stygamoeba regulata, Strain BSH-02190019" /LENGTH=159 /DNA_ID=CAMNT_0019185031 /DNA_START=110 /DNA_END=590 /DNA_ORIENTATION=-
MSTSNKIDLDSLSVRVALGLDARGLLEKSELVDLLRPHAASLKPLPTGPTPGVIHHADSQEAFDKLVASLGPSQLMLIDFHATWCGPCKMIAPQYEALAKAHPNVVFAKVDVDENPDVAGRFGVSAMPTFVAFKGGRQVGSSVRGADMASVQRLLSTHM